jgi:hypothetical protein
MRSVSYVYVRVNVDPKCIAEGRRCTSYFCPVALAMINAGLYLPNVGPYGLQFRTQVGGTRYTSTNQRVLRAVTRYDTEGVMVPFSFRLRIPSDEMAYVTKYAQTFRL